MIIKKQELIEYCEKYNLGMVVNSPPGIEEIMDDFTKIGEAILLYDDIYQLNILDGEYRELFQ